MSAADKQVCYIHDLIDDNVRWAPDRPALIFAGRNYTWRDFKAEVCGLRRGLTALGVTRGTRVSVLDRNSDRYVFLHYALASLGAVICPVNMWLRPQEIRYILDRSRPSFLLTSAEFRDLAAKSLVDLEAPPRVITHDGGLSGDLSWTAIADGPEPPEYSSPLSWDDAHMILFTSGTTGQPKGAVISHRRTVLDGMAASTAFGIRRGDRLFVYMPLFHTGAWDYLKLVFMNQGSAVLVDHFEGDEAVQLIQQHRCNLMFGVPVVLRKMIESRHWHTSDMASMRVLAFGSYDPSNFLDEVLQAFKHQGATGIEALFPYGLTEAGPFVTITRPYDTSTHPNSLGTPLPGVSVCLMDDENREVSTGEVGEICVRSPALMSGYLDKAEATAEAFRGGWLHTGDLGRIASDGFLYMVDRKKDMIRTGGENVYAKEVELLLVSHPDITEAAVVGLPDPDYGEKVVAAVMALPGRVPDEADLIAFVRSRIAGFKTPKRIKVLPDFPRTAVGKIVKKEVQRILSEE